MGSSVESSRPMLTAQQNQRASIRFSTYSAATLAPSIAPSHLSGDSVNSQDPRAQDIKSWNAGFARLEDKRLSQQRYTVSPEQTDHMSKLALGAKLERALGRRLSGQDAVFKSRTFDEKKILA
ncbi:hypothetical protein EJ05DRAFT_501904 [Pseudovirgaria hyperparasitica]|uniref:Uncharacterized protein n=1 Tax=Pseudovirgaria hyperparasitica TaxID=470096 RepID=A0A6A6W392_9PEZI|nr:uncharacterized protein EJ05DRAFT_501904 [Pseudovirgaria hyperparasitica]KAF2756400.1 hypothetical protein EJ05DRAFT_501904 [Pseudovirgaria hyperparasitica]